MIKSILLISSLCLLCSCMGGSGGSGGSSGPTVITKQFSDPTVSNFQQLTNTVTKVKPWYSFIVDEAIADTADIQCYQGEDVSFSMDVTLGVDVHPILVVAPCDSEIVYRIRRKMLEALTGYKLTREISGAGTGTDYVLDFSGGFNYDVPYTVLEATKTNNAVTRDCFLDYTFNYLTGTVSMDTVDTGAMKARDQNRAANTAMSIANPHDGSLGCYAQTGTFANVTFRFKEGKVELDQSNSGNFSPNGCALWSGDTISDYKENGPGDGTCPDIGYDSTYERWCVDDDLNGNCDAI